MPHFVASDLGLHCLPINLLGVSRLQLGKVPLMREAGCGVLGGWVVWVFI